MMALCQKHWDMLRKEIKDLGMYDFVSANGEIAAMKTVSELKGDPDSPENFDPLMRCNWMIMGRAMEIAGIGAIDDRFGCPICVFNAARTEDGRCKCPDPDCQAKAPGSVPNHEEWLAGPRSAAVSVKEMMIEKGWLSG